MATRTENLGPTASWHIRAIPETIRQAVVDKAHSERISVGELLTRLVVGGGDMVDTSSDTGATHAVAPVDAPPSHAVAPVDARETHVVDARDSVDVLRATHRVDRQRMGHPRHGVDAVAHAVDTVDADRLLKLLQAADLLNKAELPKATQGTVRALIGTELRIMRRDQRLALPPAGPKTKQAGEE